MKTNRMQLMSEGDVSKSLFKLGIPMVVSMLVTALYNVVDTYFVSGLGTQQVAAVSVAFPISFIFSGIGADFWCGGRFVYFASFRKTGHGKSSSGRFYCYV